MRLDNRTAVIVGGTGDTGHATARLFIDAGASVVITGRTAARAEEKASVLGSRARGIAVNPSAEGDLRRLFSTTGACDYLREISLFYTRALRVGWRDVKQSVTWLTGAAARTALAGMSNYAASNGALHAMTGPLAMELAPVRIGDKLPVHVVGDGGGNDDALRTPDLFKRKAPVGLPLLPSVWILRHLACSRGWYLCARSPSAAVAMRSELFSRAVPWLFGTSLIAAGAVQFTRWKMTHLSRCRSPFGCGISCLNHETSFRLGCRQGVACCLCCAGPMTIQLALGIMNPLVMTLIAMVIAAEKLLRRPEVIARIVGLSAILAGVASFGGLFLRSS